ncbi:MAG TPA: glutamate-5-semialdehyde dehydrogenase [Thermoanaerobaculia bacterium]|nr:glutamate-5-semialdehyde dehydrogenase [Thermoanaerobaculia bacterium]
MTAPGRRRVGVDRLKGDPVGTAEADAPTPSALAARMRAIGVAARAASRRLARTPTAGKNRALRAMADALDGARADLQRENERDLEAACAKGLQPAMLDRLRLSDRVLDQMIAGLHQVAAQPDPVGTISELQVRPNGLRVGRMRIPLGVIAIVYESRPNVTADAASLCLKAGNAVILRGGSEAIHSNRAIAGRLRAALEAAELDPASIQLVDTVDRRAVLELLRLDDLIDLVIPRGGESLIRTVVESTRIPVIKHYQGVCHTYVDRDADAGKAVAITVNGKVQRPAVCNATETLLVHRDAAGRLLPALAGALVDAGVELRVCAASSAMLGSAVPHRAATEDDYRAEFLDQILAVRVVESLDQAIEHIQSYGSDHTETIVTESYTRALRFLREVDSSTVLVNASTRFADGFELGLGAEIGISTTKLHAYGPMGARELTAEKFVVFGDGQIRE